MACCFTVPDMIVRGKFLVSVMVTTLVGCGGAVMPAPAAFAGGISGNNALGRMNYAELASSAVTALERNYYTGAGTWNMCVPAICVQKNMDWGADSLTYDLAFDWQLTRDRTVPPIMTALAGTAHLYTSADGQWSDIPMWDAVADVREYQATGDSEALTKAEAAFALVDSVHAASFAAGACPSIDYQRPDGGRNKLKTLETDSNYIKAALLLYQVTGQRSYLAKAARKYHSVRQFFLSGGSALYTAYVYDMGGRCAQLPGQFFASVNGNMIWAGATLAHATGRQLFLRQAIGTAQAVTRYLVDATGVFTDLQTENDIVEPLVEGMYLLATADHEQFARAWLLASASAAAADRTASGLYGRFFNGPAPRGPITAWQVNGGIAVMIAAARLDPAGLPADPWYWRQAAFVPDPRSLPPGQDGAVRVAFSGVAVAIIGTLGEQRRKPGHARVLIGGKPMFSKIGIWQGEFSGQRGLADTVLFAWRWPKPGRHLITILPALDQAPGGTFFSMTGYDVVR